MGNQLGTKAARSWTRCPNDLHLKGLSQWMTVHIKISLKYWTYQLISGKMKANQRQDNESPHKISLIPKLSSNDKSLSHLCMLLLLSINVFSPTALLSSSTSRTMSPCLSLALFLSLALLLCSDAVNRPVAWLQILLPNRHKSSPEREAGRMMCCIIKRAVVPKGMMERSKRAREKTER